MKDVKKKSKKTTETPKADKPKILEARYVSMLVGLSGLMITAEDQYRTLLTENKAPASVTTRLLLARDAAYRAIARLYRVAVKDYPELKLQAVTKAAVTRAIAVVGEQRSVDVED